MDSHQLLPANIGKPATNALIAHKFKYLEDLAKISQSDLLKIHGVGPKAVSILKQALLDNGIDFKK